MAVWASDTPGGESRRQAVAEAVAHNAEGFSQLNVEAGFACDSPAIIADGTPPPPGHDSSQEFVSSARPGHHIPHVWLERGGERVSSSDLVAATGMTLFAAGEGAKTWQAAAKGCSPGVTVVEIGVDLLDAHGQWDGVSGTGGSGAILVRPDRHVAWRSATCPEHPEQALQSALDRLLRPTGPAAERPPLLLIGLIEAGEALRTGVNREPKRFDATE